MDRLNEFPFPRMGSPASQQEKTRGTGPSGPSAEVLSYPYTGGSVQEGGKFSAGGGDDGHPHEGGISNEGLTRLYGAGNGIQNQDVTYKDGGFLGSGYWAQAGPSFYSGSSSHQDQYNCSQYQENNPQYKDNYTQVPYYYGSGNVNFYPNTDNFYSGSTPYASAAGPIYSYGNYNTQITPGQYFDRNGWNPYGSAHFTAEQVSGARADADYYFQAELDSYADGQVST